VAHTHHRQANDLRRRVEITERVFQPRRLRNGLVCLKPICSDTAVCTDTVLSMT
jgi:hypothetical protein